MSAASLHIAHVNFAKGFRGGERQTLNLIEGLAASGVAQTLVCRSGSELGARAAKMGIATLVAGNPLAGHSRVPHADIVHVHEARGTYWALIENILRGTPYLITRRIPNSVSGNVVNRLAYRRAKELVGVSRDVAVLLGEQTVRQVHAILDSCTAYAADAKRVATIKIELAGYPIIGHVGALYDHHKGQSILIAAFRQLTQAYPDARLVLLGEGPDKQEFQRLAGGDPRIVFAGFQQDVGNWIAAMDVFAFPSREEGLGSSVLDAMLLGVPVVSSAAGGLPELIGAEQRGLLVDRGEPSIWAGAIKRMLEDAALRNRLREAALEFAQAHDVIAMTRSYMALYEKIIADCGQSAKAASI